MNTYGMLVIGLLVLFVYECLKNPPTADDFDSQGTVQRVLINLSILRFGLWNNRN